VVVWRTPLWLQGARSFVVARSLFLVVRFILPKAGEMDTADTKIFQIMIHFQRSRAGDDSRIIFKISDEIFYGN
jgi:hypothetical protein